MSNALYCGDRLDALRHEIATDCGDLIYLDPPFNSQLHCSAGAGFETLSRELADTQRQLL
jgi:16S rRNA G966 N2-methylase RsmD